MAVTLTENQIGPTTFQYTWTSDLGGTPTFYVYIDGILAFSTTNTFYTLTLEPGEGVQFEVLDSATTEPQPAYPGRMTFAWYAPAETVLRYRVEEYVDAVWTTIVSIVPALGQYYFRYTTRYLEDQTTHQFRVIPVGENEADGTAVYFAIPMIRRPDKPDVTFTYSQITGDATVAQAA